MSGIIFQLTPEIIDMIIFGMENQSDVYYVDIKTGDVITEAQAGEKYKMSNVNSYALPVPEWLPSDGFQLMESFVAFLHNPMHKETLLKVLSAGRGAFRNFKNTIKENESLTQQWYLHKEKVMKSRVIDWYNLNSEILKYNNIDENTDETENLVISDFIFSENCLKWEGILKEKETESIRESLEGQKDILAGYIIGRNKLLLDFPGNVSVSVCAETVEGEFAASISGVIVKTDTPGAMVAVATIIWVEKKFRGMGISRHLIDKFSKIVNVQKCEKLIFELSGKGSVLKSSLEARGFSDIFTTMEVNT